MRKAPQISAIPKQSCFNIPFFHPDMDLILKWVHTVLRTILTLFWPGSIQIGRPSANFFFFVQKPKLDSNSEASDPGTEPLTTALCETWVYSGRANIHIIKRSEGSGFDPSWGFWTTFRLKWESDRRSEMSLPAAVSGCFSVMFVHVCVPVNTLLLSCVCCSPVCILYCLPFLSANHIFFQKMTSTNVPWYLKY